MARLWIPLLVSLVALGCAGHGAAGSGSTRAVLTAEELGAETLTSAYDAVQRLRPEWLVSRGATSLTRSGGGRVAVYMDGIRFGEADSLHNIRVGDLREIRYLTGSEATTRFGTGVPGGVIHVLTR